MDKKTNNWQIKKLGEVCDLQNGYAFKSSDYIENSNTLIFRMSQIRPGGSLDLNHNSKYLPDNFVEKYTDYILKDGDVVIAMTDMASETKILGLPTYFKSDGRNFLLNQRVGKLHKFNVDEINIKYLRYILSSPNIIHYYKSFGKGALQINLGKNDILSAEIPIPPIETQHAIVSKIEELFSELDKGIAELKTAQLQLKTYRQSVLKSAFEGKLTNENVKDGELPDGWEIIKVIDVALKVTDGEHSTPRRTDNGYFLLSARNIQNGFLALDNVDYIPEDEYNRIIKRCNPEEGDILISCSGSVGRICRVPKNIEFGMVRSVALLKLDWEKFSSKYFEFLFQSPYLQKQIEKGKKATAQANLFLGPIKNLDLIIPSLKEQHRIVQEIESRLSVADKMEQSIQESLQKAEALRQSILKKAFCGELV